MNPELVHDNLLLDNALPKLYRDEQKIAAKAKIKKHF